MAAQDTAPRVLTAQEAAARQDFLRDCANMGADRLDRYGDYRCAYEGDHQLPLTDRQREYLQHLTSVPWQENFLETVVDVRKARMAIDGWAADVDRDTPDQAEETAETSLADTIREWWRKEHEAVLIKRLCENTEVEGDFFLIVSWDSNQGRPRFRWQPPEQCKAIYSDDDPEVMELFVKVWPSTMVVNTDTGETAPIRRMNLFYPDRVEKWYCLSQEGGDENWHAWVGDSDYTEREGEDGPVQVPVWPTPWVDSAGQPLGIPAVHGRGKVGRDNYGVSGIRQLIPLHLGLNKLVLDLFEVADYMGWPWRYVAGVEGDVDPTSGPGRFMKLPADASAGQLEAADASKGAELVVAQLRRFASKARIPIHDLVDMGGEKTGEAHKSAETPLVKYCDDRKDYLTPAFVQANQIAVRLANRFGAMSLDEEATVEPQWRSSETRNQQAEATTAGLLHDLGVSKYTLLSELGYDPDEEAARRKVEQEEAMQLQEQQLSAGLLGAGAYAPGQQDVPSKPDPAPASPSVPAGGSS